MKVPVVSIVAKSGTGKTTLVEKLIRILTGRGYRVGALKHDAHRFEMDHEGKDSWRMTQAGAATTVITSPAKIAMIRMNRDEKEPPLEQTLEDLFADVDIVLTEGFKKSGMPKIEVNRQARSEKLLCRGDEFDPTLIAVASDRVLELDVPVFDLNDAEGICDFIVARFLG